MSQLVNQFVPRLLIQHVSWLPLFAQYWIACWLRLVVLNLHCCGLQFCSLFPFSYTLLLFLSHSLFAAVGNGKAIGNNPLFVIRPISTVSHIYTTLKQSKCFAVVHIKKGFTGKHCCQVYGVAMSKLFVDSYWLMSRLFVDFYWLFIRQI